MSNDTYRVTEIVGTSPDGSSPYLPSRLKRLRRAILRQ
jgi:flavin-binding protein dodecin